MANPAVKGNDTMGKVDDNKKQKKDTLLQSAFDLFIGKGFAKTTVSDIAKEAGLAKGTFYLYFKDKYDLRDKLIAFKAGQLFDEAHRELDKADVQDFDSEILFVTDYIVGCFQKQQSLLRFLAKNLSWGVFQETLNTTGTLVTEKFYDHYIESLERYHVSCPSPDLMLFTMIELIGSTSYNCILHNQPVSMDAYRPYLHASLIKIREVFTQPTE